MEDGRFYGTSPEWGSKCENAGKKWLQRSRCGRRAILITTMIWHVSCRCLTSDGYLNHFHPDSSLWWKPPRQPPQKMLTNERNDFRRILSFKAIGVERYFFSLALAWTKQIVNITCMCEKKQNNSWRSWVTQNICCYTFNNLMMCFPFFPNELLHN